MYILDSEWNDECIDFTMMCVLYFIIFFLNCWCQYELIMSYEESCITF